MVEVQFHPAEISRAPRYFFLKESQARAFLGLGLLLLALVLAGLPLLPRAVAGLHVVLKARELQRQQKLLLGQRQKLQEHQQALRRQLEQAASQLRRFSLIFGLPPGEWEPPQAVDEMRQQAEALLAEGEELLAWAAQHQQLVASLPAISPLPREEFQVSSLFGGRVSPFTGAFEFHKGLDLAAPEGLPVRATGAGTVVFAGRAGMDNATWARLGNAVVLQHGGLYVTIYGHLRRVLVREGEQVHRGQILGEVGSTGWSTNPHLHYEVRKVVSAEKAVPLDPRFFILDYPWSQQERAVGGEGTAALDLLPEEEMENLPWLKTKHSPR